MRIARRVSWSQSCRALLGGHWGSLVPILPFSKLQLLTTEIISRTGTRVTCTSFYSRNWLLPVETILNEKQYVCFVGKKHYLRGRVFRSGWDATPHVYKHQRTPIRLLCSFTTSSLKPKTLPTNPQDLAKET